MLTSALKVLINNLVKKKFLLKKTINILTIFIILYKNNVETYLK